MAASINTTITTPIRELADDAVTEDRTAALHRVTRINRRLALLLVAALVAIAAAAFFLDATPSTSRSDAAATARLNGAAAQYEAIRTSRANAAATARLDGAAAQYEAIRRSAALEADAARLQLQADVRAGR